MSMKDRFSEEEWTQIVQAPMLASLAITAADPGGLWGAVKEGSASARALMEARSDEPGRNLAAEVVAAFETSEGRGIARDGVRNIAKGKTPGEAVDLAIERLQDVAALVDAKAPEAAGDFKNWLREMARRVAEAGTEGGFLGFGGVKVSEAEKKTLADLDRALA